MTQRKILMMTASMAWLAAAEVRERGLAQSEYRPGTLRQKLFGRDRLPDTHPAARYRGAFAEASVERQAPAAVGV